MTAAWRHGSGTAWGPDGRETEGGRDPFEWLASLLARRRCADATPWPFPGGAIGHVSYDAVRELERLPAIASDDRPYPWLDFALYSWAINWDHAERRWAVLSTGAPLEGTGAREVSARDLCESVAGWALGGEAPRPLLRRGLPPADEPLGSLAAPPRAGGEVAATLDRAGYLRAVREIKERIAAGDCYEVNLSRRLSHPERVDGRRLFRALSEANPAPFAAYMETSAGCLVGSSPERFLSVRAGRAESRPIKGTARRERGAAEDRRAAEALLRSAKNRAENVMIVDLVRNDLGRVCRPGSIRVAGLCELESYSGVHHLVSTVQGELAPGCEALDAARALFPPGSMTGAPKISAMEVIERLEPVRRGPYAGAAGYIAASGDLDLSVVIRSFLISPMGVDLQVGGAVVADSDPAGEFDESLAKGERALSALSAAVGCGLIAVA
jgi:para-aminobenzoate synthetase component 1